MTDMNGVDHADSLRALVELVESGGWLSARTGHGGLLLYVRLWDDGSADSLAVRGEDNALGERANPYGQPVFRATGSVQDMVKTMTELAAPGTPEAPTHILAPMDSS